MTAAIDSAPPSTPLKLNAPVIRFAMRIRGMSQAELARQTGVDESTISRALRGAVTTTHLARQIALAFEARLAITEIVDIPGLSPGLPPGADDHDPPA